MLHDRAGQIALLDAISAVAGRRGDAEARLVEFLARCRQADAGAREVVLGCCTGEPVDGDDAELIERCRGNDPAAWAEFIDRMEQPLLNEVRTQDLVARSLAGNPDACVELFRRIEQKAKGLLCFRIYNLTKEDVADLVMVVATKVFRELPKYDARKASFETFWRMLMDQVAIDHLRKMTAGIRTGEVISIHAPEQGQAAVEIPASGLSPDQQALRDDEFSLLHAALEKLGSFDVRCRQLFERFYFEGHTYEQIAGILKMNAKTVSTGLVRCREKLREFFPKEFREQARRYHE